MSSLAADFLRAVCSEVEGEARRLVAENRAFKPVTVWAMFGLLHLPFPRGQSNGRRGSVPMQSVPPEQVAAGDGGRSRKWSIRNFFKEG